MNLSGAIRNAGRLSVGALVGILLTLISAPVLSRIYTPTELGLFNSIVGLATLIAAVSCLSIPSAISVWADTREAATLVWMSVTAVVIVAPLTTLMLSLVWPAALGVSARVGDWLFLSLVALLTGVWMSLRAFAVRLSFFNTVALGGASDTAGQVAGQAGLGIAGASTEGLSLGYAMGKAVVTGLLLRRCFSLLASPKPRWISWSKWRSFVLLLTPTLLLNQASVSAVGPTITSLLGKEYGGQFALASRVLSVPASLIGQAIATVIAPSLVLLEGERRKAAEFVGSVASFLAAVSVPVFLVPLLLGPELFVWLFGNQWREAGVVASLLSPWLALNLVSSTISGVGTVNRRLGTLLILGVIEAVVRFGGLFIGNLLGGPRLSLGLYAASGCVISLFAIAWFLRLSGSSVLVWICSIEARTWTTVVFAIAALAAKPYVPIWLLMFATLLVSSLGIWRSVRSSTSMVEDSTPIPPTALPPPP